MGIHRSRARSALASAQSKLAGDEDQRLKYAALELRMAIESVTYDRALAYKSEISPHDKVEKTLPAIIFPQVPCCIDGANRRPPENIGGVPGYEDFLAALADPNHPEHDAMSEWYGDDEFDPTAFDCDLTNQWLKKQVKG